MRRADWFRRCAGLVTLTLAALARPEQAEALTIRFETVDLADITPGEDLRQIRYHQRAMRCYGVLGRQAEGVALYERYRRILGAQLGVEPSPDTQAILTSLRHRAAVDQQLAPGHVRRVV